MNTQSFCKIANETIEHLFVDSYCVKELWELFEEWLLRKYEMQVTFDKISVLKIYREKYV